LRSLLGKKNRARVSLEMMDLPARRRTALFPGDGGKIRLSAARGFSGDEVFTGSFKVPARFHIEAW
jgi:hypothetical protein